jgi:protein-disulfide isomerase/peroxiredoxin
MRVRQWGWKKAGILVGVVVLVAGGGAHLLPALTGEEWEEAPDVALQLLDGRTASLSELEGRVVLLNFWATWCPPCRVEMPGFQRVWEARGDDGFSVVGLSTDLLPDDQIRWFLEQRGIDYMVGRGTRYAAESFGRVNTLPTSFLIDAEGRIRRRVVGVYDEGELVADVDGLLREAGLEPTGELAAAETKAPEWMELKEVGHAIGEGTAPVTVVEFSDYGCAYCSRFAQQTFPHVYKEFIQTGRVRWVHVPFVLGKFPNSEAATVAASCAGEQGESTFWAVHLTLFRRQAEWRSLADPLPAFRGYVEGAGGDGAALEECYRTGGPREALARATRVADAGGVGATPTFFIDGRRLEGAAPLDEFRRALVTAER